MNTYQNYFAGKWQANIDDAAIEVTNPADETICASVSSASKAQVFEAIEAAKAAQKVWSKLPSYLRGEHLQIFADALIARKAAIGKVLADESGKSLEDATNEVIYSADVTRYHAGWARRIDGEILESDSADENLMLHRAPLGVVACFIPFNFPVYTLLRKLAPALIAGNAVVVRPSNHTPASAFEVAKAVKDAEDKGLPKGLINILTMQHDVAAELCTHPAVAMLTLTGGLNAGRQMLEFAKVNMAKVSLELGGKTPAIVCADFNSEADLEKAASQIVGARFAHCGQRCTAIERVYVHQSLHDRLLALIKSKMQKLQLGDRKIQATHIGPLQNDASRQRIHALVQKSVEEGAILECGGTLPTGKGYFYPPTLLSNVRQEMEIVQQEIFGPALCILQFETNEEALRLANDHQFALASVLYTHDYKTVMHFSNHIEAGELYINRTPADPYQGYHAGWKRSGLGGDDGKHGMLEFTQTRLVIMNYAD